MLDTLREKGNKAAIVAIQKFKLASRIIETSDSVLAPNPCY